ncbi:MAG: hypothetical protein ABI658_09630 [Acidimicrobiales bacterium]
MNAGLFVLSCPECGGALAIDLTGTTTTSTCVPCQRSYLNRFGHLIPIAFHEPHREQDALTRPLR